MRTAIQKAALALSFLALMMVFGPSAHAGGDDDCIDAKWCSAMHAAERIDPMPYDDPKVCMYFIQEKGEEGPVVLTLLGKDGKPVRDPLARIKQANDKYCIGKHWLSEMARVEVVLIELCNSYNTRRLPKFREDGTLDKRFVNLIKTGRTPKDDPVRFTSDKGTRTKK